VALLMARLRRLEGVQRVTVANAAKAEGDAAGAQSGEGTSGGCQTTDQVPQFQMVVFFGTPQASQSGSAKNGIQSTIDAINAGTAGTTTTPAPAAPGS
jgi:hypothetical protein